MDAISHTFVTPASSADLYRVLSTPEGVRAWWCKNCEISTEQGGTHTLRFVKGDTPITMQFEVAELTPDRRVAWRCTQNDNPAWVGSTLVWDIEAAGDETKLAFTHDGFCMGGPPYEGTKQGWPRFIDSLEQVAAGREGAPL